MIKDLENVTVLWEELWLSTLQELHAGSQDVDLEDFLHMIFYGPIMYLQVHKHNTFPECEVEFCVISPLQKWIQS